MKKRPLLLIILVIITTLTLFAFPGAVSATGYVPDMAHTHYCIISSPFNEPITIEKNYNNYADASSAAKNMAHVAMYRADVQSKIATLTNEGFINYLYDGLFHRIPEEAGFVGWLVGLNNGWSRSQVIDYFINSTEFEMRYVYGYSMPPAAVVASVVTPLEVGDSYGGGIIAYIFVDGDPGYVAGQQHGIIAATADISTTYTDFWGEVSYTGKYRWSTGQTSTNNTTDYAYQLVGGTSTNIGQGSNNTDKILVKYPALTYPHTAAAQAKAYNAGGYSGWFLPSKDELNKLYLNLANTPEKKTTYGFDDSYYWSSSEYNALYAWNPYFFNGYQSYGGKDGKHYVRAVRNF